MPKLDTLTVGTELSHTTPKLSWLDQMRDSKDTFKILVLTEIRLRARRWTTLFALFLMVLACWSMIVDPSTGYAMLTINARRTLYTSSALAIGSATLLGLLLLFAGFYLIRGRVGEDLRTGIGSLVAATPVSNRLFLISRWCGGVLYFMLLAYAGMATVMVLQLVRGEPGLEVLVFLQTYTLTFLPLACYVVSIAILFDSVPWLMGKLGDLVFFILWVMQMSLLGEIVKPGSFGGSALFVFDFTGMMTLIANLQTIVTTTNFSVGGSSFDAALEPLRLPSYAWEMKFVVLRFFSAVVALIPLFIAFRFFHRYSPDRVKPSQSRQRRNPVQLLNDLLRPVAYLAKPVMRVSVFVPGFLGQVIADVALSLLASPVLIIAIVVLNLMGVSVPNAGLSGLVAAAVVCWGVAIGEISTRDFQAGMESMTDVAKGGSVRRFLRQIATALALALLLGGVVLYRSFGQDLLSGEVLLSGFVAGAMLACAAGRITRTSRLFLAFFLIWSYMASQARAIPWIDLFGFNHVANQATLLLLWEMAGLAFVAGLAHTIWKSR